MKKYYKLLCCILLACLMVSMTVFTGAAEKTEEIPVLEPLQNYTAGAEESKAMAKGFIPVVKNDNFTLFYKAESAEIAVYNLKSGEMLYSNPQDIPEDASGLSMHRMKSQLYVTYYTNNTQAKYYSSFYDSVSYGQNIASVKDDSLFVEYTFGKENFSKDMLPIAIPKDKFEKQILPKLTDEDKETLLASYKLTSIEDAKTEAARKKLIERYKNIEDTDLYALDRYIADYDVKSVYKALYSVYTQSDFVEDNKAAGGTTEIVDTSITFTLTLVYSLSENGLTVKLDCSKLSVSKAADIDSVIVLEFLGAGGKNDKGYSVIPDGSGGVINFNSQKEWASAYNGRIFGSDLAVNYTHKNSDDVLQMPVFGIAKNDAGVLAVARDGAEFCSIVSDISDIAIPYNRTAFQANVYAFDKMYVLNPEYGGGTSEVYVRDNAPHNGEIVFNYYFMDKNKNSYADFAARYRELLIADGVLGDRLSGEMPFVFSLVGAVDVKKHFLGIPYNGYEVLTSFTEAEQIIDSFSDMGIKNMQVSYKGWFNGGLSQSDISKVKILSCLGGRKKLDALMQSGKAEIYPEINTIVVKNTLFDSFSIRKDAIRSTYDETVLFYPISLSRNASDYSADYSYLLSPSKYEVRAEKFVKNYKWNNISLADLASRLNSDFSKKNYSDRASARNHTVETLEKFSEKYKVMASAPNSYAFKYVDVMTDTPLSTNDANIFDKKIPFVQMVLSGYVDMASQPINISDNEDSLLDLLTFGTLPNYTFMYADSTVLKDTDYTAYYSLCYKDWQEDAVSLFNAYAKDMEKVRGASVTEWVELSDGVISISYDNGAKFVVNKSNKAYVNGEEEIKAGTYKFYEEVTE